MKIFTYKIVGAFACLLMTLCVVASLCCCTVKDFGTKPIIAVSIPPQKEFVQAVCKDNFDIITMIPKGFSPENYEPTPRELAKLSEAKIYFTIGVPSEQNSILPIVTKQKIVELNVAANAVYSPVYIGETVDPHVWLSVKRAVVMVEEIAKEIKALDPANAEFYQQNADEYINKLNKLDADISETINAMTSKKLIVFHPAFGYLADDYGITMYSLEKEGKEATAKDIQNMIELAKQEGIKTIFYQAESDSLQAKSFATSIGGKTVMLSPLAENYIENYYVMVDLIKQSMEL